MRPQTKKPGLLAALWLLAAAALCARAEEPEVIRPVLAAYTLEAGSARMAETYLSPLKYSGWNVAMGYSRMQAMRFDPQHYVMDLGFRLHGSRTHNPAGNAFMWRMGFEASWSMSYRMRVAERWTLYLGGSTDLNAGMFYVARNGNNPVSAKASWTVGPRVAALYSMNLRRLPLVLRLQAEMPLTGVFFSPQYGELYYEIYLGNHKNLAHAAWPGNFLRINTSLTADLRLGGTTLRVGYRLGGLSTKTEHLVTREVTHSFVLGVVSEWISLSPGYDKVRSKVISALY